MMSATAASTEAPTSTNDANVPRSGTVCTNGQKLYYEIHGDGPPLVLVIGDRTRLVAVDAATGPRSVHPASVSFLLDKQRCSGRSSRCRSTRAPSRYMADDVAGVLEALDIERTDLAGPVDGKHDRDGIRPSSPPGRRPGGPTGSGRPPESSRTE